MFERFTERARQAIVLAQDEARTLRHSHIGTEHLLLGLLREEEGIAARVLESLGLDVETVRAHVPSVAGEGQETSTGQIPFTPRAKKTLELSLREALDLGHEYIGTEHMLLGLVRQGEGTAVEMLAELGCDADRVRDEVIKALSGSVPRRAGRVSTTVVHRPPPPPWRRRTIPPVALLVAGWLLFALALGIGVLVGWAIWG